MGWGVGASFYRWRSEYGGLKADQARRMKELVRENARLLDRELFHSLKKAEVLIERWRRHDNTLRPHSALGYRPPAPEVTLPRLIGPAYAALRHAQPGPSIHGPTLL